jgi:hypothetical protein
MDTAGLLPTKEMDRVVTKSTRTKMHHLVMHVKRDVNIEVCLQPTTLFFAKQSATDTLPAQFARSDLRSNASVQGGTGLVILSCETASAGMCTGTIR